MLNFGCTIHLGPPLFVQNHTIEEHQIIIISMNAINNIVNMLDEKCLQIMSVTALINNVSFMFL